MTGVVTDMVQHVEEVFMADMDTSDDIGMKNEAMPATVGFFMNMDGMGLT